MTYVVPFRGILYNQKKTPISDVVAPPYDVISDKHQEELHQRHENNVVRLILGKDGADDTKENNRHTRAANYFKTWLADNVLEEDKEQCFYLTSVEFPNGKGQNAVRYGLIAQVGIEPFENGNILPHEQTFSKVKSERLELLKICKTNFSQIFSIFSDKMGVFDTLLKAVQDKEPEIDIIDDAGERHKFWRISDKATLNAITDKMKDSRLFIADGHHRYETAMNYKNFLAETDADFSDTHPANNIMMYLCSMEDPGLIIFPTHRMLTRIAPDVMASLTDRAADYFKVETFQIDTDVSEASVKNFIDNLKAKKDEIKIGIVRKQNTELVILTLKDGVMDKKFGHISEALRKLDVTVLTSLILMELCGLEQADLDQKSLIEFTDSDHEAILAAIEGKCEISFILNATRVEQVQDIAESGKTMPRKSTYFYPKALTGLVMNKLY
jgi:uncharacterized protein (DUF1015 family)